MFNNHHSRFCTPLSLFPKVSISTVLRAITRSLRERVSCATKFRLRSWRALVALGIFPSDNVTPLSLLSDLAQKFTRKHDGEHISLVRSALLTLRERGRAVKEALPQHQRRSVCAFVIPLVCYQMKPGQPPLSKLSIISPQNLTRQQFPSNSSRPIAFRQAHLVYTHMPTYVKKHHPLEHTHS